MLTALCKDGKVDDAIEILNQLSLNGCSPLLITYIVIDGLLKVGKTVHVVVLFEEMCRKGLELDIITYSVIIDVQQGSEA